MEEEKEDFRARPYQEELMNVAKLQNTLIYLPTGSGKTFIAVMLIKELSADLENGKHTFFLVNTVALVGQQAGYIKRHSRFSVGEYSGDMNVDLWTGEKWKEELDKHQIMVMTCQIFLNLLQHNYVKLRKINLLIFDECHHAVNDQPMRQIMQHFEHCLHHHQPRVLGLTATLLNSNCKSHRVNDEVTNLERTFLSRVATCENMAEVCFYMTNPIEKLVSYEKDQNSTAEDVLERGRQMVKDAMNFVSSIVFDCDSPIVQPKADIPPNAKLLNENHSKTNKKLRNVLNDVIVHIDMLGLFGGSKACLAHIIQLERLRKKAEDSQIKIILTALITVLTAARKLFEDRMSDCNIASQIMKYSSYKMLSLIEILSKYMRRELIAIDDDDSSINNISVHQKKENFCTIIFVERRFTAKIVYNVLKALCHHDEDFNHISPDFIVGFNNNPYNDTREGALEKKWCRECLKKFEIGHTNVLVASDVLEEGMDIQKCNMVVKFDLPNNYRSYIQSKGRARHSSSHYLIMVPGDNNFMKKYNEFKETEEALQNLLVGRTMDRRGPTEEEVAADLYDHLIAPYTTGLSSVSLASAIPLVNRYCSMLPQDLFTQLTPIWYIIKTDKPSVCLQLPIASPLSKIITGPEMPTKKWAKRAVALETCKRLHQIGELNDNLLPIGSKPEELNSKFLFPLYIPEDSVKIKDQPPRGSRKRKQAYSKQFPESLSHCRPKPGVCLYLHVIEMKPVYQEPDAENNRKLVFFNLLNRSEGFAILCSKTLPQLCDFPIFMNVGEISVHLVPNASSVYLTPEEVEQLESFNTMVFQKLLKLMKPFTIVDKEDKENSYFIVPTRIGENEHEIDWDVVINHRDLPDIVTPSEEVRQNLVVSKEEFETKVIAPWYRGMLPDQSYIVTKVCPSLTPSSPFPSMDFESYQDYYERKYKLNILNRDQPLLEVKAISNKINCLRPRGMKISCATSKRKRHELQEDFEENLIAELCVRFEFPSVLWLKSTCLPTVLHRISQILLAEELRQKIASDIGIGRLELLPGEKWESLKADESCVEEESSSQSSPHRTSAVAGKVSSIRMSEKNPINALNASLFAGDKEPIDIDRNMDEVTLVEVLNFDEFIRKPLYPPAVSPLNMNGNSGNFILNLDDDDDPFGGTINILRTKSNGIGPQQVEVLQALTSSSANDIMNLERLETLGDSYIKFIASLFLFLHYNKFDEGKLTEVKSKMIGNRNLYYSGVFRKLSGYLKVQDFVPTSDWIPPGICVCRKLQQVMKAVNVSPNFLYELQFSLEEQLRGILSKETLKVIEKKLMVAEEDQGCVHSSMENFLSLQTVSDKTIADCVEALIGAYLKGSGIRGALTLLVWLKILPEETTPEQIFDMRPPTADLKLINTNIPGDIAVHLSDGDCIMLESCLQYNFRDRSYLLQALTHASYSQNTVTNCYQRLEFLGDAILDFLITCHIYESCGVLSPGELTDLRSALVNNVTFASLAVRYGFHKCMKYTSTKLMDMIDTFVKFQEENGHAINEEACTETHKYDLNTTIMHRRIAPSVTRVMIHASLFKEYGLLSVNLVSTFSWMLCKFTKLLSTCFLCLMRHIPDPLSFRKFQEIPKITPRISSSVVGHFDHETLEVLILLEEEETILAEAVEVPKVLGDLFESIAGAIYLDSGLNLEEVWRVYYRLMRREIKAFSKEVPKQPVRMLYECLPSQPKFLPVKVLDDNAVMVTVEIILDNKKQYFHGFGCSKVQAKRAAAKCALKKIKK